jgi:type IV pilus assembly protein PilE
MAARTGLLQFGINTIHAPEQCITVYREELAADQIPARFTFSNCFHLYNVDQGNEILSRDTVAMRTLESNKGFTLIEIMVVVVIVGILASIAYPSYLDYVLRSHRVDAQAVLMEGAQALERCYTLGNSYTGCDPDFRDLSAPDRYNLTTAINSQDFTLTATPQNAQTPDSCGTMTLNHLGVKTPSTCW